MENEFTQPPRNRPPPAAPYILSLISGATICLGVALAATFFLHGVASRLSNPDTREPTMQINFGRDWRNVMRGAAETNVVQFQHMQAVLKQINE